MSKTLRGVIAAIATPFLETGEPDLERLVARGGRLLEGGCDRLNLLGTTRDATSQAVEQRIAGLQDSPGAAASARDVAAAFPPIAVYPSNEATLLSARAGGPFAGCISATANLNAADCALAYNRGDEAALARAVRLRGIFDGLPLVPGVKPMIAHLERDRAHARTLPPQAHLAA